MRTTASINTLGPFWTFAIVSELSNQDRQYLLSEEEMERAGIALNADGNIEIVKRIPSKSVSPADVDAELLATAKEFMPTHPLVVANLLKYTTSYQIDGVPVDDIASPVVVYDLDENQEVVANSYRVRVLLFGRDDVDQVALMKGTFENVSFDEETNRFYIETPEMEFSGKKLYDQFADSLKSWFKQVTNLNATQRSFSASLLWRTLEGLPSVNVVINTHLTGTDRTYSMTFSSQDVEAEALADAVKTALKTGTMDSEDPLTVWGVDKLPVFSTTTNSPLAAAVKNAWRRAELA